jgi:cellulose synthase/poly-beta-1,6-N-acetylglucosamine synthase-like glycosyltransferase
MKSFLRPSAEAKIVLGSFAAYALLLWAFPFAALTVSVGVLLLTMVLMVSRMVCAVAARPARLPQSEWAEDFVSIHIATYSEPAEVVIATLDSLSRLTHPHYEVIVLDNNTPDPALYEPVRQHCKKLGPKFRFYHFDDVKGAKAGALNISLGLADPRTDAILVLDADYQAQPNILETGLSYFVDSTVGLVQFPQAYRNSSERCGLTWEYKLFFDVYMNLANHCNTVLSTGTAAFVRKHSLLDMGGWSGETLTEDAELGVRMHRAGYRGVYVPEVVAAGVMPTDFKSLRAQRRRWVLGNAQSLGHVWKEPDIELGRKLIMSMQLTAWASPLLLALVPFTVSVLAMHYAYQPVAELVMVLSTLSILWYLVGSIGFFAVAVCRQGESPVTAFRALLAHLGMQWEASISWAELFVSSDKRFVRTDKFLRAPETVAIGLTLLMSLLCCGMSLDLLRGGGCPWIAFAYSLTALILSATGYLRWNLHTIRQRTAWKANARQRMPLGERLVPAPRTTAAPQALRALTGKLVRQGEP